MLTGKGSEIRTHVFRWAVLVVLDFLEKVTQIRKSE